MPPRKPAPNLRHQDQFVTTIPVWSKWVTPKGDSAWLSQAWRFLPDDIAGPGRQVVLA
jgi:hypothetical protein